VDGTSSASTRGVTRSQRRGDEGAGYHRGMGRSNLFGMSGGALEALVAQRGEPAFRARQIYAWLYHRRAREIGAMANLPKAFRGVLAEGFELRWPEVAERALSFDGTRKYLFRLDDGATIEAVYIPEDDRRTICISTQAGCPLKCAFCLTGIAGYKRNLKPWEILGQVATVMEEHPASATHPHRRGADPFPWNVVVMGMGEPLLNYEATVESLRILMDERGFGVPPRKLTLSTVGILPALERLAKEPVRPNLAISLHAPDPGLRRALMPIEEKYSFDEVVEAALRYPIPRGGLVTFEYVLLGGVNDTVAHARELARRLGGKRVKVNLIPLNPAPEIPFKAPTPEAVDAFGQALAAADVTVSVRRPRGRDILAACGQLHLKKGAPAPGAAHP
jgi:23S rRNA (adenine2503-C2)-methyltransferase